MRWELLAALVAILLVVLTLGFEKRRPRAIRITASDLDNIEAEATGCRTSEWLDSQPCNNACSNAYKVQSRQVLSGPGTCDGVALVQTVSCPDGPCTCYKEDLLELLSKSPHHVLGQNVSFCQGVCDGAQTGDACTVGCREASGLSVSGNAKFVCVKNRTGEPVWAGDEARPFECVQRTTECPAILPSRFIQPLPGSKCVGAKTGDTCAFACHVGLAPVGQTNVATCLPNGSWSEVPRCQQQTCGDGIACTINSL